MTEDSARIRRGLGGFGEDSEDSARIRGVWRWRANTCSLRVGSSRFFDPGSAQCDHCEVVQQLTYLYAAIVEIYVRSLPPRAPFAVLHDQANVDGEQAVRS